MSYKVTARPLRALVSAFRVIEDDHTGEIGWKIQGQGAPGQPGVQMYLNYRPTPEGGAARFSPPGTHAEFIITDGADQAALAIMALVLEKPQMARNMATIHGGHFDNIKAEISGERVSVRVLVSRMTVADGAPLDEEVTVVFTWENVTTYELTAREGMAHMRQWKEARR